jgi:phosphate transport system permease protein
MSVSVKYRVGKSKLAQALIVFLAFLITLPLILIIIYIFREGITKINWSFLTKI